MKKTTKKSSKSSETKSNVRKSHDNRTTKKVNSDNRLSTKTPGKSRTRAKKSILGRLFGGKKNYKIFGIMVSFKVGRPMYIRFNSVVDETTISFVPTYVSKFEDCSKYTSLESAKEHLALLKETYDGIDVKIIEHTKTI